VQSPSVALKVICATPGCKHLNVVRFEVGLAMVPMVLGDTVHLTRTERGPSTSTTKPRSSVVLPTLMLSGKANACTSGHLLRRLPG